MPNFPFRSRKSLPLLALLAACSSTTPDDPSDATEGGTQAAGGTAGPANSAGGASAGVDNGGSTSLGGSGTADGGTGGNITYGGTSNLPRAGAGGGGSIVNPDGHTPVGDVCAAAGTPLVAAHSMTRAFFANYNGKLFQARRASDGKTQDIGVVSIGGMVDTNALDSFLSGTKGSVSILYDQAGNGNDLPQASASNQPTIQFYTTSRGTKLPMAVSAPKQYLRNRDKTSKIPKGAESQTQYFVVNDKVYNDKCCYDYGNMESKKISDGNGTMNALNIGLSNSGFSTPGAGSGPWGLVDFESGVYSAPTRIKVMNPKSPSMTWDLGLVLSKDNGTTEWTLKVGDAAQGSLTTVTNAGLPPNGYNPLRQEGGLSLGEGGDGSAAGIGAFFEGVVIAKQTTDATDDAIQANLNYVYGK